MLEVLPQFGIKVIVMIDSKSCLTNNILKSSFR